MAENKTENATKGYKQIFDDAKNATLKSCDVLADAASEGRRLMQKPLTALTLTFLLFVAGCSDQAQQQRLAQASNEIIALKIQLAKTETTSSNEIVALQIELANTEKTSSHDFTARESEWSNEVATLYAQISKAEQRAKTAEKKLVAEREQMQAAVEREKELARLAAIPEMPIKFTQRKASLLGSGFVYTFRNNADSTLPIKVQLMNPTVEKTNIVDLTINAGTSKEIGHLEGWRGNRGDVIELTSAGFKPQRIKIE